MPKTDWKSELVATCGRGNLQDENVHISTQSAATTDWLLLMHFFPFLRLFFVLYRPSAGTAYKAADSVTESEPTSDSEAVLEIRPF